MKNIYMLLLLLICGFTNAQIVNIPDANFKAALLSPSAGIDTNNDGEIQITEAEATLEINVMESNIVSMEGIEYFINITNLNCQRNQIEFLNLSSNTKLEGLLCHQNQITNLDLLQNPNLLYLLAYNNPLENINISQNNGLAEVSVFNSLLTEIDISNNLNLQFLYCNNTRITRLDVSQNTMLKRLNASNNELVTINIKNGNNTNLANMLVYDNPQLICIQVDDENYANAQICDLPNYTGWCKDETASYSEDCQLSTEDFITADFQLFPNPTENILNIQSNANIENVEIYSTQGILVKEAFSKIIDVSQLSAGIYFLRVVIGGESFIKKFVKE